MIKRFLIFAILFVFCACKSKKVVDMTGAWAMIQDGDYVELYFTSDSLYFCSLKPLPVAEPEFSYFIKEDSLFYDNFSMCLTSVSPSVVYLTHESFAFELKRISLVPTKPDWNWRKLYLRQLNFLMQEDLMNYNDILNEVCVQ